MAQSWVSPPLSLPQSLDRKHVLVMGLGRFGGGVGVAQWLVRQGAIVTVNDAARADELADSMEKLNGLPILFKLGGHEEADFLAADLIIVNPAVDRRKSPALQAAIAKKIPTTTEMNLFLERCPALTIGITGSVGKSTTTALIFEALKAGLHQDPIVSADHEPRTVDHFVRAFMGGNIGRSLLLDLDVIRAEDFVVLELSSFMLDETVAIRWSPDIAIVTNVFENHLDRHGTLAAYTAAKQNILRFQRPDQLAILNDDHEWVTRWTPLVRGKVVKFSIRGPKEKRLQLVIPGEHNQSNAAAAVAVINAIVARVPSFDRSAALRAITEFPGLDHRLQLVHTLKAEPNHTLRFYNDSKATSPEAAITALHAFPPGTAIFIVGGYDKGSDMSAFEELLARNAAGSIGIGAIGRKMVERIRAHAPASKSDYAITLEEAVPRAIAWARNNPAITAIVLSPGCASWDQFPNYEVRGDLFRTLCHIST